MLFKSNLNSIFTVFLLCFFITFSAKAEKFNSKSFMIVFACEDQYGAGIDTQLSQQLISALQQGPGFFSSVMSSSTYMKYCKPYSLNMTNLELLNNGTLASRSDGKEYILIKQGPKTTFGVIGR